MEFSLRSTLTPPDVHLCMAGEALDIFTAGQVSRALSTALGAGCRRAHLDATGVTFVDASALGVLVRARELMRSCTGSMEVVSFSPVFQRLCVLTELVSLLAVADDRHPGDSPSPEPPWSGDGESPMGVTRVLAAERSGHTPKGEASTR